MIGCLPFVGATAAILPVVGHIVPYKHITAVKSQLTGEEKKLIDDTKGEIWRNAPNRCVFADLPPNPNRLHRYYCLCCKTAEADGVTPRIGN
ncbi:hypothetical protein CFAM422_007897 [Trichoderma lentiforme]|uniref:Uncharacterized protein n=1 Tax=Trichoderma lentiforme TaxID=1567552 RepID=A0A9P5CD68_9HYPO|nr:hypothetical protein CFAM422_007897 [Trichoderma lentiforme]